ncbi:MAG: hypothetical protein WC624_05205 [Candidatus Margulisiibacteriota bacterium]
MPDKLLVFLYRRQHVLAPEYLSISSHRRQKGGEGGYGRPYGRFFDEIEEGVVEAMGSLGRCFAGGGSRGTAPSGFLFTCLPAGRSTFLFHKRKVEIVISFFYGPNVVG